MAFASGFDCQSGVKFTVAGPCASNFADALFKMKFAGFGLEYSQLLSIHEPSYLEAVSANGQRSCTPDAKRHMAECPHDMRLKSAGQAGTRADWGQVICFCGRPVAKEMHATVPRFSSHRLPKQQALGSTKAIKFRQAALIKD